MDTSLNLNTDLSKNESKPVETAGTLAAKPSAKLFESADSKETVAQNNSGKLFTQSPETAGVVASSNTSSSASSSASSGGGSISALA